MNKTFKSLNRAMKRGNLEVAFRPVFSGQNDQITGQPLLTQIPYIVRKVHQNNKKMTLGRWRNNKLHGGNGSSPKTVFYSNI